MAAKQNLTVRDIMTQGAQCVGEDQTLYDAARMMRDLDVGALPICGEDERLKGMITDRDIVIKCCAEGRDPSMVRAGDLAQEIFWIDVDASVEEALDSMERHRVKRLPVIDTAAGHRLAGIVTEQNLARNVTDDLIAQFVERVYA
ncbi:CBS domain-containing protein [Streptomyces zingiberis]|uniref:CBS domain-containing protein n=1 Tax=Streptomyces zingiberis TaxID=2053010 RepID=A0ABX1BXP0_9ACTN|nr:CBS domain-containing protein [Streptomyces zingiberis]NJQ02461.1 CBS domain-containing protein [Streptomyces zingiberis]